MIVTEIFVMMIFHSYVTVYQRVTWKTPATPKKHVLKAAVFKAKDRGTHGGNRLWTFCLAPGRMDSCGLHSLGISQLCGDIYIYIHIILY